MCKAGATAPKRLQCALKLLKMGELRPGSGLPAVRSGRGGFATDRNDRVTREAEQGPRAAAGPVFQADPPAVQGDDAVSQGEPQADAAAAPGRERMKEALAHLGR